LSEHDAFSWLVVGLKSSGFLVGFPLFEFVQRFGAGSALGRRLNDQEHAGRHDSPFMIQRSHATQILAGVMTRIVDLIFHNEKAAQPPWIMPIQLLNL
jgi:hypothetical protein